MDLIDIVPSHITIYHRKEDAKKLICEIIDKLEILEGVNESDEQDKRVFEAQVARLGYCDVTRTEETNKENWVVYNNSRPSVAMRFSDLMEVVAFILKRWW